MNNRGERERERERERKKEREREIVCKTARAYFEVQQRICLLGSTWQDEAYVVQEVEVVFCPTEKGKEGFPMSISKQLA